MSLLEQYIRDMREQQRPIEEQMVAAGIDPNRIHWTYTSEEAGDSVILRATPRLKSDEEVIGRCSDPSCCG